MTTEDRVARRSRKGLRRFRLWEKKRGTHQTGSSWWGGAGETIFFAALFLIGVTVLTELIALRVIWRQQGLLTSNWGLVLSILLLGSLIVAGAIGAIYSVVLTGTSAERRAVLAKLATHSRLLADLKETSTALPCIPDDANWKNSPGIRLAYRLPSESYSSWRLVVVASFCLIWNGAVAVLAVLAFNQGDGAIVPAATGDSLGGLLLLDSALAFCVIVVVYGVIGIAAIAYLFRLLLAATAIGPTSVEVSALPLYPGTDYRVYLTQSGHLNIDRLEVRLICDEEVSYSDGTDTRTESRRVYDSSLFHKEKFEILPSEPFQHECPLDVPADAMHSFITGNNSIAWKLSVKLHPHSEVARTKMFRSKLGRRFLAIFKFPVVERNYPLVLHPRQQVSA